MRSLECSDKEFQHEKSRFVHEFSTLDGKVFLISEEMILVDTYKSTWQEKIRRLAVILEDVDAALDYLVVMYRDPIKASYSFYVECFSILRKKFPSYFEFVKYSNQAKIFNYKYFISVVSSCFSCEKIKIYSYESLCLLPEGVSGMAKDLGFSLSQESKIMDGFENQKKTTENGYFSNPMSIREYLLSFPVFSLFIKLIPRRYYKYISSILEKIKIRKGVLVKYEVTKEAGFILSVEEEFNRRPKCGKMLYKL
ncbi:hypothetical protein [Halomonas sp. 11-S5]|uniref:hypothetical protein n=1 Tax=Halomonas sp. 11-S5 TaxID=2994064 RepID=UPI002468DAF1|nr:hypothetical protein [Halomonas sp. 11-S5]